MAKAILFDLDGTLLDDSTEVFIPPYLNAPTRKVMPLVDSEKFIVQLQFYLPRWIFVV
jgi:FMN phosphatase YigB (HAD superfamily)